MKKRVVKRIISYAWIFRDILWLSLNHEERRNNLPSTTRSKRNVNGEEKQKILRKRGTLMIGVALTMELLQQGKTGFRFSLSVHYLIRQNCQASWLIVNPLRYFLKSLNLKYISREGCLFFLSLSLFLIKFSSYQSVLKKLKF